ncbi:MAG: hypothetical protein ACOYXY_00075 [Thermodesulfobacteriota bacterium]
MINPSATEMAGCFTVRDQTKLSLNERLALIGLIEEGARRGSERSPVVGDLFSNLGELVAATVSGSKIDRLKPEGPTKGFQVFEINAESGENLGRLHMLYLKKPIPCYYLVYVEVAPPFRNRGLGNRILQAFAEFVSQKSALGILDNIIPQDDPTNDIYAKQEWVPLQDITDVCSLNTESVYMVYVPPSLSGKDLGEPLRRLVHHLERKRAAIDMRENELMVGQTIEEFRELYVALITYFGDELQEAEAHGVMRYMFTRFVTRLLGFRRRIGDLLGYTGGESLEQIALHPEVRALPIQSYAPRELASNPSFVSGDRELWLKLPEAMKKHPARMIEALPNYRRPSLVQWMEQRGIRSSDTLTIGDLIDLGFDPTRLKEITIEGEEHIFERVQVSRLPEITLNRELLLEIQQDAKGARVKNSLVQANPPLLVIRDRGNGYVLRRKVQGIHWEEALEQLQVSSGLKGLNAALGLDRLIRSTVREAREWLSAKINGAPGLLAERFAFFVSWDLNSNQPRITVDPSGSFVESIWIA